MPKNTHSFLQKLIHKGPRKLLEPPVQDSPDPTQRPSTNVSRPSPQRSYAMTESTAEDTTTSINNTQLDKKKKSPEKVVGWYRRKGDHNPANYRIKLDDSLKDHEYYGRVTEFPQKKPNKTQKKRESDGNVQTASAAQEGSERPNVSSTGSSGFRAGGHTGMPTGPAPLMSGGLGVPPGNVVSQYMGQGPGFLAPGGGFEHNRTNSRNSAPDGFSASGNRRDRTTRRTRPSS